MAACLILSLLPWDGGKLPSVVSTFLVANEQCGKLKLGKNKSITSCYNNFVYVHMECLPFVVTMVARAGGANIGLMLGLAGEFRESLLPLKDTFASQ